MIHVLTVHHRDNKWIDLQYKYLAVNTAEPFRIFACNYQVGEYNKDYFYFSDENNTQDHHTRLNYLADILFKDPATADEDLLLFLDGDAFPIADWVSRVKESLQHNHIVAIRRDENQEEYPHVCFFVTTVGFWKRMFQEMGDPWQHGGGGGPRDYGYQLGVHLAKNKLPWEPLLRTNTKDIHPVFFGVYGDIAYHHGCGFRVPRTYRDRVDAKESLDKVIDNNILLERETFSKILEDTDFYKDFL